MDSTEICEVSLVDDTGLLASSLLSASNWAQPVIFPSNPLCGDLRSKISSLNIPVTIVAEEDSRNLVEGFLLAHDELQEASEEIVLNETPRVETVEPTEKTDAETLVNFSGDGYEICIKNEKLSVLPNHQENPLEVTTADDDIDPPDRTGGPQTCATCGLTFESRKLYKKHVESHLHDKPFKCDQCSESFNYECNLNAHISTHNVDNPFCIVCKRYFSRIASLRAHVIMHQCDDTLFCPDCLEEFSSQSLLEKHRLEHKTGSVLLRFYECDQCENAYGSQTALRDHLKIVHGVKFHKKLKKRKGSYICDFCKKRFEKPSQLIRHKRIHTGERPFKCESCGKAFGQKGSLQIHMLKHSGDKPFKCTHCDSCFSQKGNLRAHVIRMHPELYNESRNFKCKLCVCSFYNASKLANHVSQFHSSSTEPGEEISLKATSPSDSSNKENEDKMKPEEQPQINRIGASPVKEESKADDWYACVDCKKRFSRAADLLRHSREHNRLIEDRIMKLDESTSASSHDVLLKTQDQSQVKSESTDLFVCTLCNQVLATEEERDVHKKTHEVTVAETGVTSIANSSPEDLSHLFSNVTKILIMENGNLEFVKGDYVVEWQTGPNAESNAPVTVVPDESAQVEMMETEKLYSCDKCNRSFKALSHWKAHCRVHLDDKPPVDSSNLISPSVVLPPIAPTQDSKTCKICDRSFSTVSSLKRHMECHETNASTYSCNLCPRQYKSRATFQKHLNSHAKSNRTEPPAPKASDKVDNSVDFQGDWNDLVQSLQPGQQYSFDIADGTSDSPGKRIEVRLVRTDATRNEIMETDLEASLPGVNPPAETSTLSDNLCQNVTVNAKIGLFASNPPDFGEKPRKKAFTCDQCKGEFESLMQLSIHKTTHLKMPCKICPICQKYFNSSAAYEKHARSCTKSVVVNSFHGNVQSFKCDHCAIGFFNEQDYRSHAEGNHVTVVCDVCKKTFKCKNAHDMHVKEHSARGIYNCGVCNAVFSTEEEIIEHIEIHPVEKRKESKKKRSNLSRPVTTKKLTEEERKLLSTVPPKSVSEKALLNAIIEVEKQKFQNGVRHEIVESSEEVHPNKCPYCPKSFRKPSDLVRHVRIHTGERPYKCTVCNKTFSIKSTAYSHVKTHTKDQSFNCHLCHKEFACIGSLKVHMRLHTGSMPFTCEICHAKFRTSGHKKAHLANHLKSSSSAPKEKPSRGKSNRNRKASKTPVSTASNISTPSADSSQSTSSDLQPSQFPFTPHDEVAQAVQYMPCLGESIIYDDTVREILGHDMDDCTHVPGLPPLTESLNDKPDKLAESQKFMCIYCVKTFDTLEDLAAHTKTHRFLECPVCHQSFKCKTDLEVHTLVHELDQWSCNGCSLAFGDQSTFKKHKCSDSLNSGVVNDLKELSASSLDLSLEVNDLFLFPSD